MDVARDGETRYMLAQNEGVEVVLCRNRRLSYPLHNHVSAFTAGLVLSGIVRLSAGGLAKELTEGQGFLIPPYTPHAIESSEPCSLLCVCIDKKIALRTDHPALEATIAQVLNKIPLVSKANRRRFSRLFATLDLPEKLPPGARRRRRSHIEILKARLELHPEVDFSLDAMARRAHTGKYHLIRRFRQEVGLTPHRFQIQNRVRKARRLLARSSSMTEAALAAGFADQSHFIRQFKKIVGMTPTSYLAACKLIEGGDELREEE